jgi:pimeloyl-ACP methyl ester carboxylesterase
LGCAKESFDDLWNFTGLFQDFSLLTFDLPGFGDSDRPKDFSYTMQDQAEICKALLDTLKPEKVHIVAHSMGGAIGLLLAENTKDKKASFINIEGNLISEDSGLLSRKPIRVSFEEFEKKVFNELKYFIGRSRDRSSQLWLRWYEKSDILAYHRSSRSLVEWSDSGNLLNKFEELSVNKVYVYGEKNSRLKVLDTLQKIRKISISKSGHFPMIDNPEEFYSTLSEVLNAGKIQ